MNREGYRWTVSVHRVGPAFTRSSKDHLDWFFEPTVSIDDAAESPQTSREPQSLVTYASEFIHAVSPPDDRAGIQRTAHVAVTKSCGTVVTATRLPDHRIVYLDYAGDVSGNRGHIKPIATGHFRPVADGVVDLTSVQIIETSGADSDLSGVVQLAENWVKRLQEGKRVRLFLATRRELRGCDT